MFRVLSIVILITVFGLPLAVASAPAVLVPRPIVVFPTLLFAPLLYGFVFVLTAGLLSRPFHKAIVPGKFSRDLDNPLYRGRRLYGLCWTCVYYFKPIYFLFLSVPCLKTMMFRLFGYRGQMDFTIYPDTWIRDLPLLTIGKGAYISNKATLGTNMPLRDGTILVDEIKIGPGALVGHLTMVAAGARLDEGCEVSSGAACGVRTRVGRNSFFGGKGGLEHMATIADNVEIGSFSFVGMGAHIGSGLKIPAGSRVPRRAKIHSQEDAKRCIPSVATRVVS
jgi:acetyltransferase-like isoleucine patch superfamily enzyme